MIEWQERQQPPNKCLFNLFRTFTVIFILISLILIFAKGPLDVALSYFKTSNIAFILDDARLVLFDSLLQLADELLDMVVSFNIYRVHLVVILPPSFDTAHELGLVFFPLLN